MPKFNVEVSYEVTEVYEMDVKDADVARLVAGSCGRAPIDRRESVKRVESVTQVSPRFEVSVDYSNDYSVVDTKERRILAECGEKTHAQMLCDALNAEEEAE